MATYQKFQGWIGYVGLAATNLNTDTYNNYLTNNTPSASADDVLADLVGITEENGYAAADEQNTYSESSGTGTGASTDITWTATSGGFGPFQYVVSYSDTHASDILRNWWDYGSALTPAAGESFTVDYGASTFTLGA